MENQINSIHWHDAENGECAGLYQTIPGGGDTWIATIEKVCDTEKTAYLLSMQCETTHYGSHDLHADSMEHAKQVASMLLLENATAFCDAYKKKIETLSAIISQLNCSVARFTEKDLQFQEPYMYENTAIIPLSQLLIILDFRDCNGLWYTRTYPYRDALVGAIQDGELNGIEDGTEELMAIRLGHQFVWTSICSNTPIHLEDLSGFFG